MKALYRFYISLLLVLALFVSQGVGLAQACLCPEMTAPKHHCCPEKQQQKPPCPHHQKASQQGALIKASTNHACNCEMSSTAQPMIQPTAAFHADQPLVLLDTITIDSVQDIRLSFVQKPIWLRRTYYPDKVPHLKTVRLLI